MKLGNKNQLRVRGLIALSAVFSLLVGCKPAQATTRVVNSTADNQSNGCTTNVGDCTLREAIQASVSNDTINFDASLSGGTISLNGTELVIARNLTIAGPAGGLAVSGNYASRVFNISAGTVRLSNLSIRNGRNQGANGTPGTGGSATSIHGGPGGDGLGGGILNAGTLFLTHCAIFGNAAAGGYGGNGFSGGDGGSGGASYGGGLYNEGTVTLAGCTFFSNHSNGGHGGTWTGTFAFGGSAGSSVGGGIFNRGSLTITNCTLALNTSTGGTGGATGGAYPGRNGGEGTGGGLYNSGSLRVTNSTLSGNTATGGDGTNSSNDTGGIGGNAGGGGIFQAIGEGSTTLINALNAGNVVTAGRPGTSGFGSPPASPGTAAGSDVAGAVSSLGHNLIGRTDGSSGWITDANNPAHDLLGGTSNETRLDPQLGSLRTNGGLTPTMALLSSSAAINAGSNTVLSTPLNLATDQRGPGFPRKNGVAVDIGAFEFDPAQSGSTLLVNTTAEHDDGVCGITDCTLSDALTVANANSDANTINFKAGLSGTITNTLLPDGLALANPVTINGPGARTLTVSGNSVSRVFSISSGVSATISGLTIANGKVAGSGGGILNTGGTLNLTDVTTSGNTGGNGGGIFNNFGTLTIIRSTISGNTVSSNLVGGSGGGIFNSGGTLVIINSTISGNTAIGPGGNSDSGGGIITNVGTVTITNSTITGNTGDIGGGIRNINGGTVTSRSSIIALNTSADGPDVNGPLTSQGFNLIGSSSGATITPAQASDQINVAAANVKLGTLENNGGPTDTIAPLSGSRAIDTGDSALTTDQRGQARPYDNPAIINASGGDGSDIGAFEAQLLPSFTVSNPRAFLEGSAASPGSTNFNIFLSAPSVQTVTVAYRTADGLVNGARAGEDYVAKSGTLVFDPGQTRKAVSVNFMGENIAELNETFFLDIHTPVNASIADSRGAAYIGNDDGPSIVIDNARAVSEGNSGTTNQSFLVRLSAASTDTITVDWANSPNTAGPADYVAASGRLTFAPGETQKSIFIQVKGDTTVETTETYRVNLTRPTFAIIADSQGIGYIVNDDVAPSSVSSDQLSE